MITKFISDVPSEKRLILVKFKVLNTAKQEKLNVNNRLIQLQCFW